MTRLSRLLLVLSLLAVLSPTARGDSITFTVNNTVSGPFAGPWMFSKRVGFPLVYSPNAAENVFAYSAIIYNQSAATEYPNPYGQPLKFGATTSTCIQENTSVANGTSGLQLKFGNYDPAAPAPNFTLTAFQHRNVVNPGAPWNIAGQAGDFREYAGGAYAIFSNGVLKLRLAPCVYEMVVPYPGPAGPGGPVRATGWGMIDTNLSDAAWVQAFDNGTGKADIQFASFDSVVQDYYGSYNATLTITSSPYASGIALTNVPTRGSNRLDFSASAGVVIDVLTNTPGGPNADATGILVQRDALDLSATFPGRTYYQPNGACWSVDSTLDSFVMNVRMDVSGVSTSELSRLMAFRRDSMKQFTNAEPWTLLGPPQIVSTNWVMVTNVTRCGQFVLGAYYGQTCATHPGDTMTIQWDDVSRATNYTVYSSTNLAVPADRWIRRGEAGGGCRLTLTNQDTTGFFRIEAARP